MPTKPIGPAADVIIAMANDTVKYNIVMVLLTFTPLLWAILEPLAKISNSL